MYYIAVNLISIFLSLLTTYIVNGFLEGILGIAKGNEAFYAKENLLRITLPLYSCLITFISLAFRRESLFSIIVTCIFCIYSIIFLVSIYKKTIKNRKLKELKKGVKDEVLLPWLSETKRSDLNYSINVYYVGSGVRGEVVIRYSASEIPDELVIDLENELKNRKLNLYLRKNVARDITSHNGNC